MFKLGIPAKFSVDFDLLNDLVLAEVELFHSPHPRMLCSAPHMQSLYVQFGKYPFFVHVHFSCVICTSEYDLKCQMLKHWIVHAYLIKPTTSENC